MPDNAFLGMRGTGDWATDQRPKSWREMILFLYPNGMTPLTAILSKMKNEKVPDPQYYWWTKKFPDQAGAVTNIYTDANMTALYSATYPDAGGTGAVVGTTLYVKLAEAAASEFRVGHQVLLRDASDSRLDVNAKVTARALNGSSSKLTIKTLEADDNNANVHNLTSCDRIVIIGNINEEGAAMPGSISYNPVKFFNYTQIFRTPLSITRTARETKLRTGDAYKEMKREALELHGTEMEKAFIFGIPSENTGGSADQKPERTTQGIINFVKANVPANFSDYRINATYSGKDWTDVGGGEDFFEAMLEQLFRFGAAEKLALCGSGALLGINKLARTNGHIELQARDSAYGIKVTEWITPYGSIYLKTHPLMSQETTTRNAMILLEPKNLVYRFITDTVFYGEGDSKNASPGTNNGRLDRTDEEFLTECGLELWHPDVFMVLDGIGSDNAV